ncbi:metalloprotease, partial [Coemansia spiralis]
LKAQPASQQRPWVSAKFVPRMTTTQGLPFEEYAGVLEQSESDTREHRLIRLPNNLVAVCVHDLDASAAAAVLSVNVGNMANPPELPGMAHFLEHMLFMGTKKYPSENEYMQFLANNSGYRNAYTTDTQTTYLFDVPNGALDGALDRFSRFFIDPLMLPGSIDREVRAVDSEYKGNLRRDNWRMLHLVAALADQTHPYSQFRIGSLESLRDAAHERGLDLRDEVARFHAQYYSADIMKLAIVGNFSTDQLVEWTVAKFSDVPSKGDTRPPSTGHPLGPATLGQTVHFETARDIHILNILFALPDLKAMYRAAPVYYVMSLLESDGPGSLLAYLRAQGWATSISGHHDSNYDGFNLLPTILELTPAGLAHYGDVLRALFAYVQMLEHHGPQRWIHEELRTITDLEHRFLNKLQALDWATHLASSGHNEHMGPAHFLTKSSLIRDYDAGAIAAVLRLLRPQNSLILVGAQAHSGMRCDREEKYFGTRYHVAGLPAELADGRPADWRKPYGFHLPARNSFLPQSTAVVTKKAPMADVAPAPTLLRLTNTTELWFKQDDQFAAPRGDIHLRIDIADTSTAAATAVAAKILDYSIDKILDSELHAAWRAGLGYSISFTQAGFQISTSGFSDRLPHLVETILRRLKSFTVPAHIFNASLAMTRKHYQNLRYEEAYIQLDHLNGALNAAVTMPLSALEAAVDRITLGDVQALADAALEQARTKVLVAGNFNEADALAIGASVGKILGAQPLPSHLGVPARTVALEPGHYLVQQRALDAGAANSAAITTFYLGPAASVKERVVARLLARLLHEQFFDQLRTKEQLGYVVAARVREIEGGRATVSLTVQGEANPGFLALRVEGFLRSFRQHLVNYSATDFATLVNTTVAAKLEKPTSASVEAFHFLDRIDRGSYDFGHVADEIACLRALDKEDLLEAWDRYADPAAAAQLTRVDSQLWAAAHHMPSEADLAGFPAAVIALHGCLASAGLDGIDLAELDNFVQTTSLAAGSGPALDALQALYAAADSSALDAIAADKSHVAAALEMALAAAGAVRSHRRSGTDFAALGMRQTPDGVWVVRDFDSFKASQQLNGRTMPIMALVPKHIDCDCAAQDAL